MTSKNVTLAALVATSIGALTLSVDTTSAAWGNGYGGTPTTGPGYGGTPTNGGMAGRPSGQTGSWHPSHVPAQDQGYPTGQTGSWRPSPVPSPNQGYPSGQTGGWRPSHVPAPNQGYPSGQTGEWRPSYPPHAAPNYPPSQTGSWRPSYPYGPASRTSYPSQVYYPEVRPYGGIQTGIVCYDIVGRPYTYTGGDRCPVS